MLFLSQFSVQTSILSHSFTSESHLEIGEKVHGYLLTRIQQLRKHVPVDCQNLQYQFLVIPPDGKLCSTFRYGWLLVSTLAFLASQKHIHINLTNEHVCALAELLIPYPLHCGIATCHPRI